MIESALLIKMYETTLIKGVPYNRFYFKSVKDKHQMVLIVFRYAIENILKWSPEDTRDNMNGEIIKSMKLDSLYRFMEFPDELSKTKDYFYIAHLLYPTRIKYDKAYYIYLRVKELVKTHNTNMLDKLMLNNDRYFELYTKKMLEIDRPYLDIMDLYNCFFRREYKFLYGTKIIYKYIDMLYDEPVQIPENIFNINYLNNYFDFKRKYEQVS